MKDDDIIQHIMAGGQIMENCLSYFYKQNIKYVQIMSNKLGVNHDDLFNAYSDSIIEFKDQIRNHQFKRKSKCSTYFYSIFKNKCIDILRKKTTNIIEHKLPEQIIDTDDDIIQKLTFDVKQQYLQQVFFQLGDKCKSILMDWNDGYTMEEIAVKNGLLNAHVARSMRYSCIQQLMKIIQNSKILIDDYRELQY